MTTIKGLDAVLTNLKSAPAQIAQLLPGPLAAAGEVMADGLRSRTPDKTGALADNVVVAVTTNPTGGKVRVGFSQAASADGAAYDKIALWLEYGHTGVNHGKETGDVPAHPFMRPAAVAAAGSAVDAFTDALRSEMESL